MKPVLVWFKRDLRVDDHEALTHALLEGPVLPVYVVEPGYWANDYTSGRQWQFVRESIAALDSELTGLGNRSGQRLATWLRSWSDCTAALDFRSCIRIKKRVQIGHFSAIER